MTLSGKVKLLLGLGAVAVACLVLTHDSMLWAQQKPTPQPAGTDINAELLAEVRGLRADMARASQTGVRAQLLMARVQLQEQRVMYFDRRRAELATRTADAAEKSRQAAAELVEAEERLRQMRSGNAEIPGLGALLPKEQFAGVVQMFEEQVKKLKVDAQAASEVEQRLQIEEADVLSVLSAEQGRWNEFNTRLDELERTLPR